MELDPNGKSNNELGCKLDLGKPKVIKGFLSYFPRAIISVSNISEFGAEKYAWNSWKSVNDGVERYQEAGARHLLESFISGPEDKDSELLHLSHQAWNAMASLELYLKEKENDGNK